MNGRPLRDTLVDLCGWDPEEAADAERRLLRFQQRQEQINADEGRVGTRRKGREMPKTGLKGGRGWMKGLLETP